MKAILSLIIFSALIISGYSQTRNVLVGTNNAVVQPTNFWSADAANARAGLGLGSAATNPAAAFQSSSSVLSNLASSNAINLTNLRATNIVGVISSSNIPTASFTNISGTLAVASGGTGATNAADARSNLGLDSAATNPSSAFQPSSGVLSNLASSNGIDITNIPLTGVVGALATNGSGAGLTNLTAANITGTVALASNVIGTIAISNGGSGATTADEARTNFGLGATNNVTFNGLIVSNGSSSNPAIRVGTGINGLMGQGSVLWLVAGGASVAAVSSTTLSVLGDLFISGESNQAVTRTNLGLGWPALTNSNAGTGLVSVNTNGEVISPTNFWQVAPIQTVVQNLAPITNSTNAATNARNLYVYSLATNITGVTNTVTLPTNTSTFAGDSATIIHQGPTSSVTAVRQAGAGSNLITINRFDESVKFIYENNGWTTYHNISFQEPIYFSGTNAAANAAASRTNLGLGATWLTNTNVTNFRTAIGLGVTNNVALQSLQLGGGTNTALFIYDEQTILGDGVLYLEAGQIIFKTPIEFNNTTNAATTRSSLGLGATNNVTFAGITNNGDITINQTTASNGLLFIRRTNNEPFLGLANLIASNNTTVSNETLFRVGVAEATNRSAQFGFRATNTNGNGVAVFSVFGYNALMMIGPSDPNAGTNPIQATISSINPTNRVMTLITTNTGAMQMHRPIEWDNTTNSAVTRTNLGLGLAALTNTNNAGLQRAVFQTNTTPAAGANLGDAKAWLEISVVTNNVTNSFRIPVFQ